MTKIHTNNPNSCYLDANIIIYFLDTNSPFHQQAVALLENINNSYKKLFTSSLCLDEIINYYRKTKQLVIAEKSLISFIKNFKLKIAVPPKKVSKNLEVFDIMQEYNLRPRDAFHVLTCLHNKIYTFATFDSTYDLVFSKKLLSKPVLQ